MRQCLKHAKSKENPKWRLAHSEYVDIHTNAIVHEIVIIECIDDDGPPSRPVEEVLRSSAPTILSSCISSILHPFSCRLICYVYLQYINSPGLAPINLLHTPSTFNTLILLGWPQSILHCPLLHTLEVFPFHRRCASHVTLSQTCWIHTSQPLALSESGESGSIASLALLS